MTTSSISTRAASLVRALEAAVAGDRDTVAALCTDDVTAWAPALSAASIAELLDAVDRRDEAFTDLDLEVQPLETTGDVGAAEWSLTMTHTGDLTLPSGDVVEATGTRVTVHGATVAEFRGDRICAVRQYWDELAVLEQLGLLGGDADADERSS